jgi:hypothetical protein
MHKSQAIARLIGPVLCAIGLGMLTNGATYHVMAGQFLATYPFIYFSGILILVAGLLILNNHHVWTPDWRSVITVLGWLMCIGGVFRILAPQLVVFLGTAVLAHNGFFVGTGIVLLAFGGFLTFKGYAV